jgi:hypothetical protein
MFFPIKERHLLGSGGQACPDYRGAKCYNRFNKGKTLKTRALVLL